ncbi:MAG: transketolase family protein [Gammaproteobacteria bacterium]|jgi:transketolase|uniref:transketolase family protein n=1 Tax=unclassified Marinomonas TaxID=196814 RepID=UPI000C1F04CB|nr:MULTISPECIES: transketolase C-terminal domain-containing protein [unclassified Marinomonas]MBU1294403.1 transketolase family protein [Gammaproteobacteria bacterium]MBU2051410.1 transketolase family protein [Gammaproteobacteria bacterium]MBU2185396.1 transketolase family protein [Gammaproteobacteria bacterium]PJE54773.1 transketolase [Marinomonas sp. BSi20584]
MSNSEHFANIMVQCFIEAVNNGVDLVPVVADSTSTAKIKPFVEAFPDRLVNVGIAEQAMVGTAAGLALAGKVAVTCNAAPFLISRSNEQVKVDICYNNTNVKLFGLNSGASYGPLASTHHSIDDISVMRGFGNIKIFAPGCPIECKQIIEYAIAEKGPVYIRMDGKALPELHDEHYRFIAGEPSLLRSGKDVVICALGSVVHEAVAASDALKEQGIEASVVNVSSIRPLNKSTLGQMLGGTKHIISMEEHNINGGLGSVIAEIMAEQGIVAKLVRLGVGDGAYAAAGDRPYTRKMLSIDSMGIVAVCQQLVSEK